MLGIDILEFKEKVYQEFGIPLDIHILNGNVCLFRNGCALVGHEERR